MSWKAMLEELSHEHEQLKAESLQLISSHQPDSGTNSSDNFRIDTNSRGKYLAFARLDVKKYLGTPGRCCLYRLNTLPLGLLYYDTLITFLFPCPQEHFEAIHQFSVRDFDRLVELQNNRRVALSLTTEPLKYLPFEWMRPLFEGTVRPRFVPWRPTVLAQFSNSDTAYDSLTESISEIPAIRRAIQAAAIEGNERYEVTEFGLMHALQELNYLELHDLKQFLWNMLLREPALGVELIYAIRRLIINPGEYAPELPHALPHDETIKDYWMLGRNLQLRNVSIPGELGAVLEGKLSYPTPTNWDGLRWCDEHLDVPAIRQAFGQLEKEMTEAITIDADCLSDLRNRLSLAWDRHRSASEQIRETVYWGTSLAVGLAGTAVTDPLTGLLAALGLTAASNVLLGPFSEQLSRVLRKSSFHIWKLDATLARRQDRHPQ